MSAWPTSVITGLAGRINTAMYDALLFNTLSGPFQFPRRMLARSEGADFASRVLAEQGSGVLGESHQP